MNADQIATVLRAEAQEIEKMVDEHLDMSVERCSHGRGRWRNPGEHGLGAELNRIADKMRRAADQAGGVWETQRAVSA